MNLAKLNHTFFFILYHCLLLYVLVRLISIFVFSDNPRRRMRGWTRFSRRSKEIPGARRVLLVTAHPDDECMFFGPLLASLTKSPGVSVYLLCLSTGNYDGIGKTRKQELWNSCKALGVNEANITCLDYAHLPDDPNLWWRSAGIAQVLLQFLNSLDIDTLITFDNWGVSGHLNHMSIYFCVKELLEEAQLPPRCRVFVLESVNWFRKYVVGVFDSYRFSQSTGFMYFSGAPEKAAIRAAMKAHRSQYVWYRRLYMRFSRYVHVNTFKELKPVADTEPEKVNTSSWKGFTAPRESLQKSKTE